MEIFSSSIETTFNFAAIFEGHYVPKDVTVTDNGKPLLHIRLVEINPIQVNDIGLDDVPSGALQADDAEVERPAVLFKQNLLRSKENLPEGFVVLSAEIGRDGHARRFRILKSSDELLTSAAIMSVQEHVFERYTVKGVPVNTRRAISFDFKYRN